MKKHTHDFTLIEIMTVLVIIGVLAGILYPVLGHVQNKGKITEAKTLVSGMKAAVLGYLSEYNFLPNPQGKTDDQTLGNWDSFDGTYNQLSSILAYTDCENKDNGKKGNVSNTAKNHNGNGTRFITPTKSIYEGGGIIDPWGFQLRVLMDYGGDGKVKSASNYDPSGPTVYLSPVVVFCRGLQDSNEGFEKVSVICSERR